MSEKTQNQNLYRGTDPQECVTLRSYTHTNVGYYYQALHVCLLGNNVKQFAALDWPLVFFYSNS